MQATRTLKQKTLKKLNDIGTITGAAMMPRSVSYQGELLKYLHDPHKAVSYLNAALEDGDPELFVVALRNVAEAQGLANTLPLNSQSSSADAIKLEIHSLLKLLKDLGLGLALTEISQAS
ncbi:MAG: DNA-binding protein [Stenomitos frigidus ULC029]